MAEDLNEDNGTFYSLNSDILPSATDSILDLRIKILGIKKKKKRNVRDKPKNWYSLYKTTCLFFSK